MTASQRPVPHTQVCPNQPFCRWFAVACLIQLLSLPVIGQEFGFEASLSPEGTLQFTNITNQDIPLWQFELTSSLGQLVPMPPGDLRATPDPFTFLLANSPEKVTYGNLRVHHTVKAGETWTTGIVYPLAAATDAGDQLVATYQNIDQTLSIQGICGITAATCPEPGGNLLVILGLSGCYLRHRRRRRSAGKIPT